MFNLEKPESYYLFLDESGTAELADGSHTFVLNAVLVEVNYYKNILQKKVRDLKEKYKITHLPLHSSDIRKQRNGYAILTNKSIRGSFLTDINDILFDCENIKLFPAVINKQKLKKKYYYPADPYNLAMRFVMEQVTNHFGMQSIENIFCESRNKHQNRLLQSAYNSFLIQGTSFSDYSFCSLEKMKRIFPKQIIFVSKKDMNSGAEIADLTAYPLFRFHSLEMECEHNGNAEVSLRQWSKNLTYLITKNLIKNKKCFP